GVGTRHRRAVGGSAARKPAADARLLRRDRARVPSLDRPSGTLSGGEAQRTKMIHHLGSSLTDVSYVFDEPTVGLHPHDHPADEPAAAAVAGQGEHRTRGGAQAGGYRKSRIGKQRFVASAKLTGHALEETSSSGCFSRAVPCR